MMTFHEFQRMNERRCIEAFDEKLHSPEFFAIAIAGEAGEMCNELKKVMRGDHSLNHARPKILAELADIITYCDLMITKLNADTESTLLLKFNEVSKRRNWNPE